MIRARDGVLIGLLTTLAALGSAQPVAAAERPVEVRGHLGLPGVRTDTAMCLTPTGLVRTGPESPAPMPSTVGSVDSWPSDHAELQPKPKQYREECGPDLYQGELSVPLWHGPPWGVPSVGGFI